MEQNTADVLAFYAHQQVGNGFTSEWRYTENIAFKVQSLEEGEGSLGPNKNLQHETNKIPECDGSNFVFNDNDTNVRLTWLDAIR